MRLQYYAAGVCGNIPGKGDTVWISWKCDPKKTPAVTAYRHKENEAEIFEVGTLTICISKVTIIFYITFIILF